MKNLYFMPLVGLDQSEKLNENYIFVGQVRVLASGIDYLELNSKVGLGVGEKPAAGVR